MNTKEIPIPSNEEIANQTLVLILAGGRGSRLYELTDRRAKPAVYFGGGHRIIDFALSNCLNSGLLKIGVITQYAAHSLLRHLQHGWSFLPRERGQFVDMLPARQQLNDQTWYRGTADAVWQNVPIMQEHYQPKYVLILAGDHIYKMDYMQMIRDHVTSGAKATVGCIEVPRDQASAFGVMAVNENLKVKAFIEKPQDPPAMPDRPGSALASMGIYVFDAHYLYDVLEREASSEDTSHDFGNDIIPAAVKEEVLYAHPFEKSSKGRNTQGSIYWRDVGTIDSYWNANIDLVSEHPQLDMFDKRWPIRTVPKQTAPTKFFYKHSHERTIDNSLIGGSGVITDAEISNSVLFDQVEVDEGSKIEYAVLLPQVKVGKNCALRRCVIDRNCEIPDGMNIGIDPELDKQRFRISPGGVVLVTSSMLDKLKMQRVDE